MLKKIFHMERISFSDKVLDIIFYIILLALLIVCAYPIYFVLIASVSNPDAVNSGRLLLYPVGFHLEGYKYVIEDSRILVGYMNTLIYTICGTFLGLAMSIPAGYVLSRKDLAGGAVIMKLLVFTMYFSGGLIPTFLVVKGLNLVNTRTIVILLGCVSVYNIILIRNFCQVNVPDELHEATQIDGCDNFRFFFQFVIPLSKAIIAVIALYLAVGYWNSYYTALVYINDPAKKPLQLILRDMLMTTSVNATDVADAEMANAYMQMVRVVKYAVIVVSTAPIMCLYPFLQKYFVQGVMIGAVKG